jgi:hypothetical protein
MTEKPRPRPLRRIATAFIERLPRTARGEIVLFYDVFFSEGVGRARQKARKLRQKYLSRRRVGLR